MKGMPYEIKQKLRQYAKANNKARTLHEEIVDIMRDYGVPYDNLVATSEFGAFAEEDTTEALAFINNCEGDIDGNITEIEEVFLYFVNKNS